MGATRVQVVVVRRALSNDLTWRLLGPNNRELGRSSLVFPDPRACLEALSDLVARLLHCGTSVSAGPRKSAWTWQLELDGAAVAVASRTYYRQRECDYSLERFRAALPTAILPRSLDEGGSLAANGAAL